MGGGPVTTLAPYGVLAAIAIVTLVALVVLERTVIRTRAVAVIAAVALPLLFGGVVITVVPMDVLSAFDVRGLLRSATLLAVYGAVIGSLRDTGWRLATTGTALGTLFAAAFDLEWVVAALILLGPPIALNLWLRRAGASPRWPMVLVAGLVYPGLMFVLGVWPSYLAVIGFAVPILYGLAQLRTSWWVQVLIAVVTMATFWYLGLGGLLNYGNAPESALHMSRVRAAVVLLIVAGALLAWRRASGGGRRTLGLAAVAAAIALAVLVLPARAGVSTDSLSRLMNPVLTPAGDLLFVASDEDNVFSAFMVLDKGTRTPRVLHDRFGSPMSIAPDGSTMRWADFSRPISYLWTLARQDQAWGVDVLAPGARGEGARRVARGTGVPNFVLGPRGAFLEIGEAASVLHASGKVMSLHVRPRYEEACFDDGRLYVLDGRSVFVVDLDRLAPRRFALEAAQQGGWSLRSTAGSTGAWLVATNREDLGPQPYGWAVVPLGPEGPGRARTGTAPVVFARNPDGSIEARAVPSGGGIGSGSVPWFGRRYGDVFIGSGSRQEWYEIGTANTTPLPTHGDVQLLPDSIVYAERGGQRIVRYWPAERRTEVLFGIR